jgi:hypothetical protein
MTPEERRRWTGMDKWWYEYDLPVELSKLLNELANA